MSLEGWLGLIGLAIQAVLFAAIFRKAGYSGWLGLLMLIPVVNFVTLIWFAGAYWPLEAGYEGQPGGRGSDTPWELKMAVRKALALEKRGESAAAARQFDRVAEKAGEGHPTAAMARERAQQLRAKG